MNGKASRNTVLVIDDDPDFRTMVETYAEFCGVPILQASDCTMGLTVLKHQRGRIKLILLDYLMPGMEPARCAAAIIAKAGPAIPVVLVTAAPDPAERAAELHLSRWILKPFDGSTLTRLLEQD
jgi:CheY-like chemotaxis protein